MRLVGSLARIPTRRVRPEELVRRDVDHRAAFLFGFVDGRTSLETILDSCGLPRGEALELLTELVRLELIALD